MQLDSWNIESRQEIIEEIIVKIIIISFIVIALIIIIIMTVHYYIEYKRNLNKSHRKINV